MNGGTLDVGSGTVDVDTLHLDTATVTASSTTIRTALTGNGSFSGDLTLDPADTSTVTLAINSLADFDKIVVGGALNFAGHLNITLGFTPTAGDTFDVFDFASHSGTFIGSVGGATWDTTQLYTDGILKYQSPGSGSSIDSASVPEPATLALMAAVFGIFGVCTNRRRGIA